MPLNKLDNFLKNVEGRILYVSPSDLDSTDSILNEGNSQTQPFKTLQRALLEAARFSYQKGNDNDLIEKTTILLMPGEHEIDNRPGYAIQSNGNVAESIAPDGTTSSDASIFDLTLEANFDLTQSDNVLYKFNSVEGGVIVPRGTSIVGLDLRKTKIRPKYVPNPTDSAVPSSAIFRITGGCYFWQFSIFDGESQGRVYTHHFNFTTNNLIKPLFSHHKLTCFEYADGVNKSTRTGLTDLDMYYAKLSRAYNSASTRNIAEKYPISEDGFAKQRAEWEIVGAFADDPITITSIKAGTTPGVPTNEVFVTTSVAHNLTVGTPIKIRNVRPQAYNVSTRVTTVDTTDPKRFTYTLSDFDRELQTPGDASQSAQVTIETDTVSVASPYIFNCSLRSVYGMQGMHADGSKADGFRSMVVAQFTGVSLQKDDRAFVKYISANRKYEGNDASATFGDRLAQKSSSTNPATMYHLDSGAVYRSGWESTHVRITNDAILQIVSVFAIGYNKHFNAQSGGDASITNSNSNFGQLALVSEGFRKKAFEKDDRAYITHIIPPKAITSIEETLDWLTIDKVKTLAVANTERLYLYGYTSEFTKPTAITQGFRIGARKDDILYLNIEGVSGALSASILMVDYGGLVTTSSVKKYMVNTPVNNIFTVSNGASHRLFNGEKVKLYSDDADLPENILEDITYYVIRKSATQFQLAASLADALSSIPNPINVYQGTNLKVLSTVTDKDTGDLGHPIQWDSSQGQWYINVNSGNTIYSNLGSAENETEPTYLTRIEDERNIDEKIYKVRVVIPKESNNSKNPENGFIIQESSDTAVRNDSDFTKDDTLINRDDYNFNRNPRYISSCTYSSPLVTITCENPHNLTQNDQITIKNAKSTDNTVGAANSGYNGTFDVVNILNDMQFAYNPGRSIPTSVINDFNKTATGAVTGIPRFERTDLKSNIYVYRNEIFSEYSENSQDGVYHIYPLSADYNVTEEFTSYQYGQNVRDLYPQLDRDNYNDNPEATKSFAVRNPLGKVVTNDLQKSLTRETTDKLLTKIGVGHTVSSVNTTTTQSNLTFSTNHGLAGLSSSFVKSGSINYNNGTFYNVKVTTDSSNTQWNGTLATVVVSGGGIIHHKITNPGSGWQVGDFGYFDKTQIGAAGAGGELQSSPTGTSAFTRAQLGINEDLTVQVTGAGTTQSAHYRLLSVPTSNTVALARTTGDPLVTNKHYAFVVGPAIKVDTTTTTSTIEAVDVDTTVFSTTGTNNAHGLTVGNKFQINDSSNNNRGTFIVKALGDLNGNNKVTKFNAITTGSNVGGLTNGYVLRHGLSAHDGVSEKNDENLNQRGVTIFDDQIANLYAQCQEGDTTIEIQLYDWAGAGRQDGVLQRFPYGSYLQIDDEIIRISSTSITDYNESLSRGKVQVLRGLFGTPIQQHDQYSLVKKIKPIPIELHRPSILRASGHTFEYLGYGPGNYSTALPQVQVRKLTEREEFLSQSQERGAGAVVYTGMNDKGDFYIGNQKKSALTGEEVTFDTPVPTVAGEDPGRLSVVFDEVTVKDRLVVEGGKSKTSLTQFDGPVTFNNELKIKKPLKLKDPTDTTVTNKGSLIVSGGVGIAKNLYIGGNFGISDDSKIKIGKGAGTPPVGDLEIYHDSTVGSEQNIIKSDAGDISIMSGTVVKIEDEGGVDIAKFKKTGGSILYHDGGAQKFTTSATGADVTGVLTCDGITIDGTLTATGLSITGNSSLGDDVSDTVTMTGPVTLSCETDASSKTSGGTLTVSGGAAIAKKLYVGNDIVAFATSDKNLKDDISPIVEALSKVKSISGNTFKWNEKSDSSGKLDTGVIAQEIDAIGLPGSTVIRDDGTYAISYNRIIPLLIEAIKELSDKVDALS